MRLPRMQFTVRRMMVAVALVAAVLSVVERRERLKGIAVGHKLEKSKVFKSDLEIYLILTVSPGESGTHTAERERACRPLLQFNHYHDQMIEKYERAASRPWLPVAPDPPPPAKQSRDDFKAVYLRLEGKPYPD